MIISYWDLLPLSCISTPLFSGYSTLPKRDSLTRIDHFLLGLTASLLYINSPRQDTPLSYRGTVSRELIISCWKLTASLLYINSPLSGYSTLLKRDSLTRIDHFLLGTYCLPLVYQLPSFRILHSLKKDSLTRIDNFLVETYSIVLKAASQFMYQFLFFIGRSYRVSTPHWTHARKICVNGRPRGLLL